MIRVTKSFFCNRKLAQHGLFALRWRLLYIYISSIKRASLNHCINFIRLKEKLRATKFSHFLPKFLSLLITIVCCKQQKLYTSNSLKHRLPTQSETQTSLRINADRWGLTVYQWIPENTHSKERKCIREKQR